jgi:hypothetical protein
MRDQSVRKGKPIKIAISGGRTSDTEDTWLYHLFCLRLSLFLWVFLSSHFGHASLLVTLEPACSGVSRADAADENWNICSEPLGKRIRYKRFGTNVCSKKIQETPKLVIPDRHMLKQLHVYRTLQFEEFPQGTSPSYNCVSIAMSHLSSAVAKIFNKL